MKKQKILKLHKLLSTTVLVLSLIWILSGFSHPIMGWTKPSAKQFRPPSEMLSGNKLIELKDVLENNEIAEFQKVRLINILGQDTYQVHSRPMRYFNAETGEEIEGGDDKYAIELAKYYGQKNETVSAVEDVTSFGYQYPFINRLLPVKRVSFAESGEDYYVHTRSSRLGTVGNTVKDSFSLFFKLCHNLSFLDSLPWLKFFIMAFSMLVITFTAFTGLWLFFKTLKQKRKKLRKWHVWSGVISAQAIFLLTFSGLFHIGLKTVSMGNIKHGQKPALVSTDQLNIKMNDFTGADVKEISLLLIKGEGYLRKVSMTDQRKPSVTYHSLNGKSVKNDREIAIELAGLYAEKSSDEIDETVFTPRFTHEYGFVNKRLPVWKVNFKGSGDAYYVETSSTKLAAKVTQIKRIEGLSFAYLHKAHFLDFLGKDMRNIVLMLFCLLIGFTAVSGNLLKR